VNSAQNLAYQLRMYTHGTTGLLVAHCLIGVFVFAGRRRSRAQFRRYLA